MLNNNYKAIWEKLEASKKRPKYASEIITVNYDEFAADVEKQDDDFVNKIVNSLYKGDIYILKNGFPKIFMENLRDKVFKIWNSSETSFHKMVEGCPDFHRRQDEKIAKKYVFESIRHSYYWFHWNGDPMSVIPEINKRWRVLKFLGGLNKHTYEKNTPKDGVVDRFQVARYLPGIGKSETHSDPYQNQRFFISVFMSKKGLDYKKGGFYVVKENNQFEDVEKCVDIGDISIGYATVMHGVDIIDPDQKPNWLTKDGRWWLGLYSNSSDMVLKRAQGVKVKIPSKFA